jgi:uncharacterized membrane protein
VKSLLFVAPLFETECGYLLRALAPAFSVRTISGAWRGFSHNAIPDVFPGTAAELGKVDAVIFSDVGRRNFDVASLEAVGQYVRSGGGFLMIGGHASFGGFEGMGGWADSPLEDLLPVTIPEWSDAVQHHRGFYFEAADVSHPAVSGIDFSDMPVAIGFNRVTPRPDAKTLLRCGKHPILCVREVGKGRTAAYMSDAHPHWSGGWTDWPHYAAFWQKLLGWVCGG